MGRRQNCRSNCRLQLVCKLFIQSSTSASQERNRRLSSMDFESTNCCGHDSHSINCGGPFERINKMKISEYPTTGCLKLNSRLILGNLDFRLVLRIPYPEETTVAVLRIQSYNAMTVNPPSSRPNNLGRNSTRLNLVLTKFGQYLVRSRFSQC